jgi:DNA-directed RNA polymerase subunit RPC12/RpoP
MGLFGKSKKSAASEDDDELECPVCGGTLVFQNYAMKGIYNVTIYECQACGNEVQKKV